jgi:macrolide-specific efflux system membrane fusion protein
LNNFLKRYRKWLIGIVLTIGVLSAIRTINTQDDVVTQTQQLFAQISIGDIENLIPSVGSIQPVQVVEVGAQVSGQLLALHVEAGDFVNRGDLLAEIDASQQISRVDASRANLAGLEAQLESARSNLNLAELNVTRQANLMGASATSQLEYDTAVNNYNNAQASLTQLEREIDRSRASLAIEERELEFTQVIAPIDGTVMSVTMAEGRTLNASQQSPTILTIADLATVRIQAEISEADVGRLREGMEVYFTTLGSANRRWVSTLDRILPQPIVENNVVFYTGLFDVVNEDNRLLPEMTAQVYFVTSSARDVLVVPMGALSFNSNDARSRERQATVDIVNANGDIQSANVTVGLTSRTHAEVISGLNINDQVVIGNLETGAQGVDRQALRSAMGFPGN